MATFKMQLNELEKTLLSIEETLKDADEKSKFKVMFICEELLTNLVRHADFQNKTPSITLDIQISQNNTFELECRDNAKAFDILKHKNPEIDADIDDRELGGLGIYLLKKYAKNMEYYYEKGFNILRLSL
jgi:serine/threonine-protein kinase RsbW